MSVDPGRVISFPVVAQRAAQRGYTLAYRIWLIARHVDVKGGGYVKLADLHAMMALAGMNLEHYRRARNSKGWDVFFKPHDPNAPEYICYVSDKKVREALKCARENSVFELSLRTDFKSLFRFNAKNYAAWFRGRPGGKQTISREHLCELWGVSKTTLLRWEEVFGLVQKESNFGTVAEDKVDKVAHMLPRNSEGDFPASVSADGMLIYQLPNTYSSIVPMIKRVRRGEKGDGISGVATTHHKKRFIELDNTDRSWQLAPDKNGQYMRDKGKRLWTPKLMRVARKVDVLM